MILYDANGQPLSDPFEDALKDMDAAASMMITLYNDGTLTVDCEVDRQAHPEGLPVLMGLKMLNDAGKTIYDMTDDDDESKEAFDGQE